MPAFKDLTDRRFGRLVAVSRAPNIGEVVCWRCACDCGTQKIIRAQSLLAGATTSCGCILAEKTRVGCSVDGCKRRHYANGFCALHGSRLARTGTTDPRPITGQYVAREIDDKREWEHRIIAARVLGKPLPPKAQVHHVDDDGRNNANDNLVICQDAAYHKDLHRRRRILRAGGNPHTDYWCSGCRTPRPRALFNVRQTGPAAGRPICYCSPCASKKRKEWSAAQ